MGVRESAAAIALLLAVISASCSSSITQAEAESIAMEFVKERVKFFARSENSTFEIPSYSFDSVTTTAADGSYVVQLNVTSTLGDDTKSAYLQVIVDSTGKVTNLQKLSSR